MTPIQEIEKRLYEQLPKSLEEGFAEFCKSGGGGDNAEQRRAFMAGAMVVFNTVSMGSKINTATATERLAKMQDELAHFSARELVNLAERRAEGGHAE